MPRSLRENQRYLLDAADVSQLGARLMRVAADWAPGLLGSGTDPAFWRAYDIWVVRRELGSLRGLLRPSRSGRRVAVASQDHPRVQRFTVAHELAHVLIEAVDRPRLELDRRTEERLCDRFASHLLIPRADLRERLEAFSGDPSELLAFVNRYEVSLSAFLAAAAEQLDDRGLLAFAVSERGHPDRPEEVCHRVHGVHCPPFFMPEGRRLTSLGLTSLATHFPLRPERARGADAEIELPLWQPRSLQRSGFANGAAQWRLSVLPNGFGLVCLDTTVLELHWAPTRQSVAA